MVTDGQTDKHPQTKYCNPRCSCAPRVNYQRGVSRLCACSSKLRVRLPLKVLVRSTLFSLYSRHISRTQEKCPIKIKDLATFKRFMAVIGCPVICTARTQGDRQMDRQTDRHTKYRNPRCAFMPRVNNVVRVLILTGFSCAQ